ncbi:hypothetical protein XFF6166_150043 [Xanthomonas citri pv. fuscans]|nr:hypothetical protein XFF6166_150043 [Xanthomonas citri pv. fuscans]
MTVTVTRMGSSLPSSTLWRMATSFRMSSKSSITTPLDDRVELLEQGRLDFVQARFRHEAEVWRLFDFVKRQLAVEHQFHVFAVSAAGLASDTDDAMHAVFIGLINFHFLESFALGFNIAKELVQPNNQAGITGHLFAQGSETAKGVAQCLTASNNGVDINLFAVLGDQVDSVVFGEVIRQRNERRRAVIHHEIGIFFHDLFNEAVEVAFYQRAFTHQLKALSVQRLITGEGGIYRVSVIDNQRATFALDILRDHRSDQRFTDAAFALQNVMNLADEFSNGRGGSVISHT